MRKIAVEPKKGLKTGLFTPQIDLQPNGYVRKQLLI